MSRKVTGRCLAVALVLVAASIGCGRGDKDKRQGDKSQGDKSQVAFTAFPSLNEALSHIWADEVTPRLAGGAAEGLAQARDQGKAKPGPLVVGIGEFHQTTESAPVRSAIERFTDAVDIWASGASDLVVETWVEEGNCGKTEEVVSADVRQTTQRPPVIENHLVRLAAGAKARGATIHALPMRCDDYASVLGQDGAVDYEKMLVLIKRKLGAQATDVFTRRQGAGSSGVIVLYGGALHNDRAPYPGLEDLSYAPDIMRATGGRYVEIDLYVPEYVAGNALVTSEPWYPVLEREAAADKVLVIRRGPSSYAVILRKDERAAANP